MKHNLYMIMGNTDYKAILAEDLTRRQLRLQAEDFPLSYKDCVSSFDTPEP